MSTFQLEVGGNCANGAEVMAVYKDSLEGVVLAKWHDTEYVTWTFLTENQSSTAHGNYYRFNKDDSTSEEVAWDEANKNFLERITKMFVFE